MKMRVHGPPLRSLLRLLVFLSASVPALAGSVSPKCEASSSLQQKIVAHPSAEAYDELGAYFGQNSKFSCAISAFRSSLLLMPNSSQTHYYLALALLDSGDAEPAARELRTALKLKPDLPQARLSLGVALSQLNQLDAAIEEFYAALKADPRSVTALDWLTKSLISASRYPEAIALLKNGPQEEVLQMNLAIAYSKAGDNEQAIEILSQILKERPSSAAAHSGLATVYTQQQRYHDAAAEFQETLRLNPQDDLARISYIKVLIVLAECQTALPLLQKYRERHPDEFESLYLLGAVDRELGNYDGARDMLTQAVKMNPDHYDARYNLGVVLAKLGKPAQARAQLEKASQLDPSSSDAHFQLAAVLRSLGLQDEAREQLDLYHASTAARAKKDIAAAKATQAKESLQENEIQTAVDLYKEAAAEDPANSRIFYDLAMALDRKGDYQGERESLERAAALDPRFARPHNQIGFLSLQAGQVADAEKEFKTAIALDPHFAEAQNNLGVLYGQKGNDAEAERLFRQAIRNDPSYAQSFINLAVTLASESRFAEADLVLQDALRIQPDNQEAQEAHAMIHAEIDRQNKAAK